MTQAFYAHRNNKIKKKRDSLKEEDVKEDVRLSDLRLLLWDF
jgi:hypothetical protein